MKKRNKLAAWILAGVLACGALTGCGGSGGAADSQGETQSGSEAEGQESGEEESQESGEEKKQESADVSAGAAADQISCGRRTLRLY